MIYIITEKQNEADKAGFPLGNTFVQSDISLYTELNTFS